MKAKVLIIETSKGFYLEIDNGYGNRLTLTDTLHNIEDAQKALEDFKATMNEPVIERL